MLRMHIGLAAVAAIALPSSAGAQDLEATVKYSSTGVQILPSGKYKNFTLSIIGPNEYQTSTFSEREGPAIDLRKADVFDDGSYTFYATAASDKILPIRTPLNNGRDDIAKEQFHVVTLSGSFEVVNGKIVPPKDEEEDAK